MAGHGFVMFGWSEIEESDFGSEVFGQASMEGCARAIMEAVVWSRLPKKHNYTNFNIFL